jgi:hypothetical protein
MPIETILLVHLARYPAMQLADMYKLIHQAALGSEHAIRDPESARNWLTRELAGMGDGCRATSRQDIPEPLTDPLSDETGIVRIHLRPYIASGSDPDKLLEAFIRTANEFLGSTQTLENYWEVAARLSHFPAAGMITFIQSMRTQNYPAVHHSTEYERLYCPAYRVIKKEYLTLNG